jgi:hypothetical protein
MKYLVKQGIAGGKKGSSTWFSSPIRSAMSPIDAPAVPW